MAPSIAHIKALEYTFHVPTGRPINPILAQKDAIAFIDECNSADIGYLHAKTVLKKATFRELVECVKIYSKAIVLAIYSEVYAKKELIVSGKENINTFITSLIKQLTIKAPWVTRILMRVSEHREMGTTSLIFHIFEKYLCDPHTSPFSVPFFEWMGEQPLDALTTFINANHDAIIADPSNACFYIMDNFDASAVAVATPTTPPVVLARPPIRETPQPAPTAPPVSAPVQATQTQPAPPIHIQQAPHPHPLPLPNQMHDPAAFAHGIKMLPIPTMPYGPMGGSIGSPRLDFRWLQNVPEFGLTISCTSIEEASEIIQFVANLRARCSADASP